MKKDISKTVEDQSFADQAFIANDYRKIQNKQYTNNHRYHNNNYRYDRNRNDRNRNSQKKLGPRQDFKKTNQQSQHPKPQRASKIGNAYAQQKEKLDQQLDRYKMQRQAKSNHMGGYEQHVNSDCNRSNHYQSMNQNKVQRYEQQDWGQDDRTQIKHEIQPFKKIKRSVHEQRIQYRQRERQDHTIQIEDKKEESNKKYLYKEEIYKEESQSNTSKLEESNNKLNDAMINHEDKDQSSEWINKSKILQASQDVEEEEIQSMSIVLSQNNSIISSIESVQNYGFNESLNESGYFKEQQPISVKIYEEKDKKIQKQTKKSRQEIIRLVNDSKQHEFKNIEVSVKCKGIIELIIKKIQLPVIGTQISLKIDDQKFIKIKASFLQQEQLKEYIVLSKINVIFPRVWGNEEKSSWTMGRIRVNELKSEKKQQQSYNFIKRPQTAKSTKQLYSSDILRIETVSLRCFNCKQLNKVIMDNWGSGGSCYQCSNPFELQFQYCYSE